MTKQGGWSETLHGNWSSLHQLIIGAAQHEPKQMTLGHQSYLQPTEGQINHRLTPDRS